MRYSYSHPVRCLLVLAGTMFLAQVTPAVQPTAARSERVQNAVQAATKVIAKMYEQLADIRNQADAVASVSGAGQGGFGNQRVYSSGGTYQMTDLRRSAGRLESLASELGSALSDCDKEGKRAGQEVRTSVSRLASSINRAANNRDSANRIMELTGIDNELDEAEAAFQRANQSADCVPEEKEEKSE